MRSNRSIRNALLTGGVMLAAWPGLAAEVTPQRLANPEPQNWLMNHRTYDAQRYSPLDRIASRCACHSSGKDFRNRWSCHYEIRSQQSESEHVCNI
jgi:hypothetical protein